MKNFFLFVAGCLLFDGIAAAYSTITQEEINLIDSQINTSQSLSLSEKKRLSQKYYRIAQQSLEIRKAFSNITTELSWVALTRADYASITSRIRILKELTLDKREEALEKLKRTQFTSYELWRAFECESNPLFEGYWITKLPTPVFWLPRKNPDINSIMGWNGDIKFDSKNLVRELAVVLPPDSVVTLLRKIKKGNFVYYEIRTREFDWKNDKHHSYYIDSRFITISKKKPSETLPILPEKKDILSNLKNALGSTYIRWWSRYQWIPEMEVLFPSSTKLSLNHKTYKSFKWVDCSWLLYQATNYYTPRNTTGLLSFWEFLPISGKSINQIIKLIKPLDLIIWQWHVIIVYDDQHVIESKREDEFSGWVVITPTKGRLQKIFQTRSPVNSWNDSKLASWKKFVIKRWYQE